MVCITELYARLDGVGSAVTCLMDIVLASICLVVTWAYKSPADPFFFLLMVYRTGPFLWWFPFLYDNWKPFCS